MLFLIWNIALDILRRENIVAYIRSIFTGKNILEFLVLNESPLAGHLWYLGAILYVLVIVLLVDKLNCRKLLYYLTPVLLIADLVFGKYSLLIFHQEFPYILVRNFLCVGIPYFCIGNLIMDKLNCRKLLYYLTPVLLIADLVFGKYSLLIFHQEFPYILVRNFLCVGIPYFCIGNLIREKRCSEKWNKKVLQVLIIVFVITSLAERFVLVNAGLNATRDHYISTTFLAICLFVYTLKSDWHNKGLAVIGRKYSTWLYIIHPIFITVFSIVVGKLGLKLIYRHVAPIVVYCATLVFLIVLQKVKIVLRRK